MLNKNNEKFVVVFVVYDLCKNIDIITLIISSLQMKIWAIKKYIKLLNYF